MDGSISLGRGVLQVPRGTRKTQTPIGFHASDAAEEQTMHTPSDTINSSRRSALKKTQNGDRSLSVTLDGSNSLGRGFLQVPRETRKTQTPIGFHASDAAEEQTMHTPSDTTNSSRRSSLKKTKNRERSLSVTFQNASGSMVVDESQNAQNNTLRKSARINSSVNRSDSARTPARRSDGDLIKRACKGRKELSFIPFQESIENSAVDETTKSVESSKNVSSDSDESTIRSLEESIDSSISENLKTSLTSAHDHPVSPSVSVDDKRDSSVDSSLLTELSGL